MNRQIKQLGVALVVLFAILFVQLNVTQVLRAEELTSNPLNARRVIRDFGQRRGQILTSDGVVIAESVEVEGRFARERRYPQRSDYAHVTGYFSFEFGATGVERTYNDELSGHTEGQRLESLFDFFGDGDISADLHLTIDSDLQLAAVTALGHRKGSVVALDPATGAVLAFTSYPTFDPNMVSAVDLDAARAAKVALDEDPAVPLLTRAHREVFAPGSTFKVITAASAIETGRATATSPVFPELVEYELPLTNVTLRNFAGRPCGGDLATSLARSCNTTFAELGAEYLGPEPMIETAERFGFNDTAPFDVPLGAESRFPDDYGIVLNQSEQTPPADIVEGSSLLAQAAIGQYDVRATPLQMALVAAGVANGGEIMVPHVGDRITDAETGREIDRVEPELWQRALSPDVAEAIAEMMVGVVQSGSAVGLARPGLVIGAKTGTAEVAADSPTGDTHAWMIAFAGSSESDPDLAIAVVVEAVPGAGQQTGSAIAGPVAAAIIDAAYQQ